MSIIQINKDININSSKLDFHLSSTISSIDEYDTDDATILLDESNSTPSTSPPSSSSTPMSSPYSTPRKKKSKAWDYFTLDSINKIAKCSLCETKLAWHHSTSSLSAHLFTQHDINTNQSNTTQLNLKKMLISKYPYLENSEAYKRYF